MTDLACENCGGPLVASLVIDRAEIRVGVVRRVELGRLALACPHGHEWPLEVRSASFDGARIVAEVVPVGPL